MRAAPPHQHQATSNQQINQRELGPLQAVAQGPLQAVAPRLVSLDPEYRGGRPRRVTDEQRKRIVAVAGARPDTQGAALTRWSLPRLADHLAEQQIVAISPAHLGRVLADAGLSFQRTRTWKASPDPDYETKTARVLELRAAAPPDGGAVIAFDQMGPISLRPMTGAGWAPTGRPERQRATYHRRHGVRYVMGAYDVHADRLRVRLRPRRRGSDNLTFMAQIRAAIASRRRIYWIQDDLSANWTPDIRSFAAANRSRSLAAEQPGEMALADADRRTQLLLCLAGAVEELIDGVART